MTEPLLTTQIVCLGCGTWNDIHLKRCRQCGELLVSLTTHWFPSGEKRKVWQALCADSAERAEREYLMVSGDPWWGWTGSVMTQDPHDLAEPEKSAPAHEYLRRVIHAYLTETRLIVWKSRQMMLTWVMCWLAVWEARFHRGRKILIQVGDKSEDAADDLIKRCYFIDTHLPPYLLKHRLNPRAKGAHLKQRMDYPAAGSEIVALAAGPTSGAADQFRQFVPSRIILDEFQLQDHGAAVMQAVNPIVPKVSYMEGGGGLVVVGTSKVGTYFQQMVLGRAA